jgi:probable phosphoglycerate mutase
MGLKIHLLRHGQTALSRENVFCGSGVDPELTTDGDEMARQFAAAYRNVRWGGAYVSPLRRAVATAQPLCDLGAVPMQLCDGLKEIGFGRWEGQSVETVEHEFPEEYLRWSAEPGYNAPTGGETAHDVAARAMQVVDDIRAIHQDGQVLVVSHKATIRILICALLGLDAGRYRFCLGCPVGSVSVVEFTAHGPLLHSLADRTHLSERLRSLPGT